MNNDADKKNLNKKIDQKLLYDKIMKYCGYQERSEHDVLEKLKKYRLGRREMGNIIGRLKEEKFIDDRRFASIYASGKLRNNKWGRIKIRYELKRKNINSYHIEEALNSIGEEEYTGTILDLIDKKREALKGSDKFILRNKIAQYLFLKGFENDLVWEKINERIP
jgi:regulatory protein